MCMQNMPILVQKMLVTGSSSSITKKRRTFPTLQATAKEKMYGQKNLEKQVGIRCNRLLKMHNNIQFDIVNTLLWCFS